MERAVAQRVLANLTESDGALQDAIGALRETTQTPDVREAIRRLAILISLTGSGVYHPIYFEHPDLCPEGLRFMTEKPPQPKDWPWGESGA
jgi:hypothetical protein